MKSIIDSDKPVRTAQTEELFYSTPIVNNNNTTKSMDFYDKIVTKKDRRRSDGPANYAYVPTKQVILIKAARLETPSQRSSSVNEKHTPKKSDISKSVKDYHNIWSSAGDLSCGKKQNNPTVPKKAFNLQTDDESEDNCRETNCPPKITETSGFLAPIQNKVLVRPIAFKPVIPQKQSGYSPDRTSFTPISQDDGYSSRETSRSASNSASTTSRDSDTYSSPTQIKPNHEYNSLPLYREGGKHDSHMESLLQEKESEISRLRQTMELNESAIIRVQEQKRIEWEKQMQELAQEYHRRLRVTQDTSRDRESELRQVIAQLELDKRQFSVDMQQNQLDRDRQNQLAAQIRDLKQRNTETSQKLTEQSCECELLRHRNKELEQKLQTLEERLSMGQLEQQRLSGKIAEVEMASSSDGQTQESKISELNERLEQQERMIQKERDNFRAEQEKWREEKEKVLQYQKQLQSTYVQMYKRNNELESQLCRINSRRTRVRSNSQSSLPGHEKLSFFNIDLDSSPESFC